MENKHGTWKEHPIDVEILVLYFEKYWWIAKREETFADS